MYVFLNNVVKNFVVFFHHIMYIEQIFLLFVVIGICEQHVYNKCLPQSYHIPFNSFVLQRTNFQEKAEENTRKNLVMMLLFMLYMYV